ncbi:unnamed protein product [Chrysoparadoxa australica]
MVGGSSAAAALGYLRLPEAPEVGMWYVVAFSRPGHGQHIPAISMPSVGADWASGPSFGAGFQPHDPDECQAADRVAGAGPDMPAASPPGPRPFRVFIAASAQECPGVMGGRYCQLPIAGAHVETEGEDESLLERHKMEGQVLLLQPHSAKLWSSQLEVDARGASVTVTLEVRQDVPEEGTNDEASTQPEMGYELAVSSVASHPGVTVLSWEADETTSALEGSVNITTYRWDFPRLQFRGLKGDILQTAIVSREAYSNSTSLEEELLDLGATGVTGANATVGVTLDFRLCSTKFQPHSKGWCQPVMATNSVAMAAFVCRYGLGGEGCNDETVSGAEEMLQAIILVLSNLAALPSVIYAMRLGKHAEPCLLGPGVAIGVNALASGLYHLCDLEVTCALGMRYDTLQAADFFSSFFSVCAICVHISALPTSAPHLVPPCYVVMTLLLLLATDNGPTKSLNQLVVVALCVLVVFGSWGREIWLRMHGNKRNWRASFREWDKLLAAVKLGISAGGAVLVTDGVFYWQEVGVAVALFTSGFLLFEFGNSNSLYPITHSIWHVVSFLASFALLRARRQRPTGMQREERVRAIGWADEDEEKALASADGGMRMTKVDSAI